MIRGVVSGGEMRGRAGTRLARPTPPMQYCLLPWELPSIHMCPLHHCHDK